MQYFANRIFNPLLTIVKYDERSGQFATGEHEIKKKLVAASKLAHTAKKLTCIDLLPVSWLQKLPSVFVNSHYQPPEM